MKNNKEAYNLINQAKNILVTTHQAPDGDAIGSICAITLLLKNLKKNFTAIIDSLPDTYEFIPGTHHLSLLEESTIILKNIDLIITLDFNEISRSPLHEILIEAQNNNIPFINIDHHQANSNFGTVNLVNKNESSTTCLLHKFFCDNNLSITPDIATALLTGILTDTDHLSNSSTTPYTVSAASHLLIHGAHLYRITQNTRGNKTINTMNLWGEALNKLQHNKKWNIAYTIITQQDLKKYNVTSEAIEGIPNFLTSLHNLNAILVLKETEEHTLKGSLRTTNKTIDVAELAKHLGGGGHKKAAGFSINGLVEKTKTGWKII